MLSKWLLILKIEVTNRYVIIVLVLSIFSQTLFRVQSLNYILLSSRSSPKIKSTLYLCRNKKVKHCCLKKVLFDSIHINSIASISWSTRNSIPQLSNIFWLQFILYKIRQFGTCIGIGENCPINAFLYIQKLWYPLLIKIIATHYSCSIEICSKETL